MRDDPSHLHAPSPQIDGQSFNVGEAAGNPPRTNYSFNFFGQGLHRDVGGASDGIDKLVCIERGAGGFGRNDADVLRGDTDLSTRNLKANDRTDYRFDNMLRDGDLTTAVIVKLGVVDGDVDPPHVDGRQDARGRGREVGDGASYSITDRISR